MVLEVKGSQHHKTAKATNMGPCPFGLFMSRYTPHTVHGGHFAPLKDTKLLYLLRILGLKVVQDFLHQQYVPF